MRILFVCTGNTCRSPMSVAIARQVAAERGLHDLELESAGTGAHDGTGASDGALLVAMERGNDLSGHRSRHLTRGIVDDADLVLVMGDRHLQRVAELGGEGKAFLLTDFASHGGDVHGVSDPFGGDLDTYRQTYDELEQVIRRAFDRIGSSRTPPDAR